MLRRSLLILPAAAALPRRARAQGFPDRPVTMVVPYAPGGSADVLARVVGPAMAEALGQPVVVELRPGAGGNVGAAYVAHGARADGHTFLFASLSLSTAPALGNAGFDPQADLVPVAGVGAVPNLLVVSPASPFLGVADVVAAARARPGEVSFGSSGPGTGSHLSGELLAAAAGIRLLHVPYRGSGAVYPDLIAQRIALLLDVMGSSSGQVQAGAVRAIGITSAARSPAFPDVPTIAEQGLPGFEFATWFGFFARAGTPPEAAARLEAAILHALEATAVRDRLRQAAAEPIPRPAAAFRPWFAREVERWRGMVASGRLARLD
ncbi:MAG: tripartite tricarboxylate transporter substrate binding protein [Acetobacteraceae bacterium]|nr:tripartite tricarboxylate transporter substrate binding protein [Acetobacteraceae bacterium]